MPAIHKLPQFHVIYEKHAYSCRFSQWANATAIRVCCKWIHPTIAWRRDEHGTHKHAHGSWILCSALRHISYLTLPYVTSLRGSFYVGTFAAGFISCSLAINKKLKEHLNLVGFKRALQVPLFRILHCCFQDPLLLIARGDEWKKKQNNRPERLTVFASLVYAYYYLMMLIK